MPEGRGDPGGSGPGDPMAEGRADPAGPAPADPRPIGYELLEHTADVGIRASGPTLEAAFEQATEGLADVLGALAPEWSPGGSGPGEAVVVRVAADDPGGLLVDWLNEVLWLREVRQAKVAGVRVERVGDGTAAGRVAFSGDGPAPDGTFVKAVTYHRLRVEPDPGGGWLIEVYLDV
ncbi:MAG TPA: archease [Actinomycetota bacterium]